MCDKTLIYCDIDGVLHRWPCPSAQMFDPACMARLESVIRPHNAGLVITSTWRLELPLKKLQRMLGPLGACLRGVTPEIDDPFLKFRRYHEVLEYQEQHAPAASRWIAIDDEPGRYPGNINNLILTDPRVGFSEKDALRLSNWLGHKSAAY